MSESGDVKATMAEKLYGEYHFLILKKFSRLKSIDLEDAVSKLALRSLGKPSDMPHPVAYVSRSLDNYSIEAARMDATRTRREHNVAKREAVSDDDKLEKDEVTDAVLEEIAKLPARQAAAVYLKLLKFPHSEAAEFLSIGMGSYNVLLSRALLRLKESARLQRLFDAL